MSLAPFTLHRPATLSAALDLLDEHDDAAAVYMGGTELLLVMKLGLAAPEHLVDCKRVPDLRGITVDGSELVVGAGVTHRDIELDAQVRQRLPQLARLAAKVANVRVRSAGTIGGNLCFAEPHSDPATMLIALGASAEVASPAGTRRVPLETFFVGPLQTALEAGEILTRIFIPLPQRQSHVRYERFKFRERPVANVAAVWDNGSVRLVVGAVGATPVRIPGAEQLLASDPSAVTEAADAAAAAVDPYDDNEGSADYKRHLVRVLVKRVAAAARA